MAGNRYAGRRYWRVTGAAAAAVGEQIRQMLRYVWTEKPETKKEGRGQEKANLLPVRSLIGLSLPLSPVSRV